MNHITNLQDSIVRLRAGRDKAWQELREIRDAAGASCIDSTADEVRRIVVERDAALSQNAELVAMVTVQAEFLRHVKKCLAKNGEYAPLTHKEIDDLIAATPTQHLRQIQAEAGRAGFIAGVSLYDSGYTISSDEIEAEANKYAAKVRQGGE